MFIELLGFAVIGWGAYCAGQAGKALFDEAKKDPKGFKKELNELVSNAPKKALNNIVEDAKNNLMTTIDIMADEALKNSYLTEAPSSLVSIISNLEARLEHKGHKGDEYSESDFRQIFCALSAAIESDACDDIVFFKELKNDGYYVEDFLK